MHHTPGAAVPDSGCPFFYKMFRYHTASVSLPIQAAAVCYRMGIGDVEFLLVRTSSGKWTFPKGCVEPGFSHRQIAAKEALEEAGVIGSVAATHLHVYLHPKGSCKKRSPQEFAVKAFLLQVKTLRDPQEVWRKPTWFTAREAKKSPFLETGTQICG